MVTSPQQIIRNRMYELLTSLLHCRFKDIDELKNRIAVQYRVYNVVNRLVESQNKIIEKAVKKRLKDKFYDICNKADEIIENLDYINVEVEKRGN